MGPEERQPGREPGDELAGPSLISPSGQNRALCRGGGGEWVWRTGGGVSGSPTGPLLILALLGAFTFSQGLGRRQQGLRGSHMGPLQSPCSGLWKLQAKKRS